MIINPRKYYAIYAKSRDGISLQIGTTKQGFKKLGDILSFLQKKTKHPIGSITITDLWEKKTEVYTVKYNRLFKQ